jgi:hypothetical protein
VSRIMMFAIIDKKTVSSRVFTKRGSPGGSPCQIHSDLPIAYAQRNSGELEGFFTVRSESKSNQSSTLSISPNFGDLDFDQLLGAAFGTSRPRSAERRDARFRARDPLGKSDRGIFSQKI